MAVGLGCLKESVAAVVYVFTYVLFEISVYTAIVTPSLVISRWITRAFGYAYFLTRPGLLEENWLPLSDATYNALNSTLCCWLVAAFALLWTKSWSNTFTPTSLENFQERRHPHFCASLKNIIVTLLLIVCTCFQICTYIFKFNRPHIYPRTTPVHDMSLKGRIVQLISGNDFKFLASLYLLVYLAVRVFRYHRNVCKTSTEIQLGELVKRPQWRVYLEHYYGLLGYELFVTDVMVLITLGLGAIFEINNKVDHWFPYLFSCFIGTGFGILFGDVEERLPWLDNRMGVVCPYYRTIHWNVRLHLLALFLLPLLNLNYFQDPSAEYFDEPKVQLLHNLVHLAFISNIWMSFAKGSALFSYVIRGHFWNRNGRLGYQGNRTDNGEGGVSRGRPRNIHGCSNNRIAPQNPSNDTILPGSQNGSRGGRVDPGQPNEPFSPSISNNNNVKTTRSGRVGKILKNILTDYFPVSLSRQEGASGDQGSVSTGTCTSLLNRHNNSGNVATVEAVLSVPDQPNSSLPDFQLPKRISPEEGDREVSPIAPESEIPQDHDILVENQQQVENKHIMDNVEEKLEEMEETAGDDGDAIVTTDENKHYDKATTIEPKNVAPVSATDLENPAPIKLKRCPPVLLLHASGD